MGPWRARDSVRSRDHAGAVERCGLACRNSRLLEDAKVLIPIYLGDSRDLMSEGLIYRAPLDLSQRPSRGLIKTIGPDQGTRHEDKLRGAPLHTSTREMTIST